jgi:hypothetical protein
VSTKGEAAAGELAFLAGNVIIMAGREPKFQQRNIAMYYQAPWFVGWGTLSLINAGLAQSKGRSGLLWWLISLLIGPIATLLIVVLPKP